MAVDIHLKIDTIEGQSEINGFQKQIQVESFSWNMQQTTSFGHSTGGGAGKVNMGDLVFTHNVDKASPKLMAACCMGTHLKEAILTCRKAGGESAVDFLKVTLTDVIVSSVSPSGTNSGDTPNESVSLAFAEYKVEYQEQDNKGAKKGGPIIAGYSIQQNKKTA